MSAELIQSMALPRCGGETAADEACRACLPTEPIERLSLPRRGGAVELNFIEQRQPDSAKN